VSEAHQFGWLVGSCEITPQMRDVIAAHAKSRLEDQIARDRAAGLEPLGIRGMPTRCGRRFVVLWKHACQSRTASREVGQVRLVLDLFGVNSEAMRRAAIAKLTTERRA